MRITYHVDAPRALVYRLLPHPAAIPKRKSRNDAPEQPRAL